MTYGSKPLFRGFENIGNEWLWSTRALRQLGKALSGYGRELDREGPRDLGDAATTRPGMLHDRAPETA